MCIVHVCEHVKRVQQIYFPIPIYSGEYTNPNWALDTVN